jgi:crotonobetainyl-CoA:carnitine CoA-transferase CaiB-like acyl-CoA transferase
VPQHLSWQPLDGLSIELVGTSRALAFAGRTLTALGASIVDADPDIVLADETPPPDRLCVTIDMGVGDGAPACGLTAAARGGVATAIGAPEREPLGLPFDIADHTVGLVACVAALDALSTQTSASVSAPHALATFAGTNGLVYEPYGIPWTRERRRASQCGGPYPYGFWRAADGYVCAIVRARGEWERVLDMLGRPEWSTDERYSNLRRNGAELADELDALIEPWTSARTRAELLELAERHGVALAPVRRISEVGLEPTVPFRVREQPTAEGVVPGPLSSARVVDFGWVWSAPMVGAALADVGADVVKVEHRARPDNSRLRGRPQTPGWLERQDADSLESVPYFLTLNRGKRSVELDLKDVDDAETTRRLLAVADVVVENFGSRVFERLGLSYEAIVEENPGLIWLSMPPHLGERSMRGYAPTLSSYSGLEHSIGYPGDLTGMMTFGLCDAVAGTWGQLAVLAAWRERGRTGRGRYIELGQLEGLVALLGAQIAHFERTGDEDPRGDVHDTFDPYGCFICSDGGAVAVAGLDEAQRRALADLLDGESLPAFVARRTRADAVAALRGVVACEPVATHRETRDDPSLPLLVELRHPLVGRHAVYAQPWLRNGEQVPVAGPAPCLGQDDALAVLDAWSTKAVAS